MSSQYPPTSGNLNVNGTLLPQLLQVDSLGVGITEETLQSLSLTNQQQYLLVGDNTLQLPGGSNYQYHPMLVDMNGVAIMANRADRTSNFSDFALFVDGDVFVRGNFFACNIQGGGIGSNAFPVGASNYWTLATNRNDSIYYNGNVTLGNNAAANANQHPIGIVKSANLLVDNLQLGIQNQQNSRLRVGAFGSSTDRSNLSPMLLNTTPGVALEFHIGRDQSYFQSAYLRPDFPGSSNLVASQLPRYTALSNCPHLVIDTLGNVAIQMSNVPFLSYSQYRAVQGFPLTGALCNVSERMSLYVSGPTYVRDLVVLDRISGGPRSLDDIYVRKFGITIPANQVVPGDYAFGNFNYNGRLGVNVSMPTAPWQMVVASNMLVTSNLTSTESLQTANTFTGTLTAYDKTNLNDDVTVRTDLYVRNNLKLFSGIQTLYSTSNGSNIWCNVQFTISDLNYQQFNQFGTGLSTIGRFGVGIDPNTDSVLNQFAVHKSDTSIFEIDIQDRTNTSLIKAAYIGHYLADSNFALDGSLIFTTPAANDPYFNLTNIASPQNFYFYPGQYSITNPTPIVRLGNPPTLNVSSLNRVGVKTYQPLVALDVNGDISFTGNLYFNPGTGNLASYIQQARWDVSSYADISPNNPAAYVTGTYLNAADPHVGIGEVPSDSRYALMVTGGVRSRGGFYIDDNLRLGSWFDANDSNTVANYLAPPTPDAGVFTFQNVGIGVNAPEVALDITNNYDTGPATIRMRPGPYDKRLGLVFQGLSTDRTWSFVADQFRNSFTLTYGCNMYDPTLPSNPITVFSGGLVSRHQVIINGSTATLNCNINPNPTAALTVNGALSVLGDVSITGRYIVNGNILQNSNVVGDLSTLLLQDQDVAIAGQNLLLFPASGVGNYKSVILANSCNTGGTVTLAQQIQQVPKGSILNIFQNIYEVGGANPPSGVLAAFNTVNPSGLIQISAAGNNRFVFGIRNDIGVFEIVKSDNTTQPIFSYIPVTVSNPISQSNVTVTYFAFSQVTGQNPTATVHIQNDRDGTNMLRLTRYATNDTTPYAPTLDFQKLVGGTQDHTWQITGPNAAYNQKLSFLYKDPTITGGTLREIFCFTNNGCLGIGKSNPDFALDIISSGKAGSLRILDTSARPTPQIILQSGSPAYGSDSNTDYRFIASNNNFILDAANNTATQQLFYVGGCNQTIGLRSPPSDLYDVVIGGRLNVTGEMYLGGNLLFSQTGGSNVQGSFTARGNNIFLVPTADPVGRGGVMVNSLGGYLATQNLFYIRSGWNRNLLTLDSIYDQAQVHLRSLDHFGGSNSYVYRMAAQRDTFYWAYSPPGSSVVASNATFEDTSTGYFRAMSLAPSTLGGVLRVPGYSNDFDLTVCGSLRLAPITQLPVVEFSSNGSYIGGSNGNLALMPLFGPSARAPGHVGIGLPAASNLLAKLHIRGDTGRPVLYANQASPGGSNDIVRLATGGQQLVTVDAYGRLGVGVGATVPAYPLHVYGSNFAQGGSAATFYQDRANVAVGGADYAYIARFENSAALQMVVDANGSVGMGTTTPLQRLHVSGGNQRLDGTLFMADAGYFSTGGGSNLALVPSPTTGNLGVGIPGTSNLLGKLHVLADTGLPALYANQVTPSAPGAAPDLVRLATAGQRLVTVDGAGRVGIGVGAVTPSFPLHVYGSNTTVTLPGALGATTAAFIQDRSNVSVGASNYCYIARFHSSAGPEVVVDANGWVGIGTTLPQQRLHVAGQQRVDGFVTFQNSGYMAGDLEVQGNIVAHQNSLVDSDARLKTDLVRIGDALDRLTSLTGYTYTKDGARSTGLLAQDVQAVLPEAVRDNGAGYLALAYGNLMGLVVEAIKELKNEVADLRARLSP